MFRRNHSFALKRICLTYLTCKVGKISGNGAQILIYALKFCVIQKSKKQKFTFQILFYSYF
ncbi:MAG: hypothetical protein ACI924_000071 [Flavobacterium sp.]|jgi:hypothetical protein